MIDPRILDALRIVESGNGRYLRSKAGALGPYQLLPGTARDYGVDPMDEDQSRWAAGEILQSHLDRFGDLDPALMAYHAGAGNVAKYQAGKPSGVGPKTLAYPDKVRMAMGEPTVTSSPREAQMTGNYPDMTDDLIYRSGGDPEMSDLIYRGGADDTMTDDLIYRGNPGTDPGADPMANFQAMASTGEGGGGLPQPGQAPGGLPSPGGMSPETRKLLLEQIRKFSQPAERKTSIWSDPMFLAGLTMLSGGNMGQAGMAAARIAAQREQNDELSETRRATALSSLTGRLAEGDKANLAAAKEQREAMAKSILLFSPTQRGRAAKIGRETNVNWSDPAAVYQMAQEHGIPFAPNFKAVAGVGLVDENAEGGPKVIIPVERPPHAPPADVAEYEYAKKQGYQGSIIDYQKEKKGGGGPFAGTGMDAQVGNVLNRLGPKIQDGTATEEEQRVYAYAYAHAAAPKPYTDTETGKVYFVPQEVPAHFPKPTSPAAPPPPAAAAPNAQAPQAQQPQQTNPSGVRTVDAMPPKPKEMTEGQANAALYADRMRASEKVISEMEAEGLDPVTRGIAKIPLAGNYLVGSRFQQLDQAKRDFINATLRRESGAVISPAEFESADKQYFPVPGDSSETLAQKKQNRRIALEGISRAAGKSYAPRTEGSSGDNKFAKMAPSEIAKVDVLTLSPEDLKAFIEATKK